MKFTALHLVLPFLRGYCPTCVPLPVSIESRIHKARCLLKSMEKWQP